MKTPILENNQCSVLSADFNTGVVLDVNFETYKRTEDVFHIFNNYEEAIKFIHKKLAQNPNLEFNIYDKNGDFIMTKDVFGKKQ